MIKNQHTASLGAKFKLQHKSELSLVLKGLHDSPKMLLLVEDRTQSSFWSDLILVQACSSDLSKKKTTEDGMENREELSSAKVMSNLNKSG